MRLRSASHLPAIAKPAASPNEAMNQDCHKLKLEPASKAHAANVAKR